MEYVPPEHFPALAIGNWLLAMLAHLLMRILGADQKNLGL